MRLKWVHIQNYRSCKDVRIEFSPVVSLVGANNAGKSTILRALDFFFNPSTTKLTDESFWALDTTLEIRVEALFIDLSHKEIEKFRLNLRPDGTLLIARSAKISVSEDAESDAEPSTNGKIKISQHYCKPVPKYDWLSLDKITGAAIDNWWREKDTLIANGHKFTEDAGNAKPGVGLWKEKADEFARRYLTEADNIDSWVDNPQGYAGVLKGGLPHFIFIPAVRDVADETKVTKSNPLGRLLYSVLEEVTDDQSRVLTQSLQEMQNLLNRTGGAARMLSISETERRLNTVLSEYMDCDLEIEFQPPTLEVLLTTPHIYADDGFRNLVENKGHGLQRAIIFSILRCYSELVTGSGKDKSRTMIMGIEEPELYMHPQAQRTIQRVFHAIADAGDQVVFTTHSSLLLDVAYFDEIVRVETIPDRHKDTKTVQSRVWQLPMEAMLQDIRKRHPGVEPSEYSVRQLYANAYHPTRAEGFFAKRLILVEGATEYYSLPIYAYAKKLPLDSLNIGIVECGGKGPMDKLYKVFNELGIPCYLVFDYDKEPGEKESIAKSREILQLIGKPPDPPAELLVDDHFACFPTKWELELAKEIPDMEALTHEARSKLGLSSDTGKALTARYIATALTSREPPFIPPSIGRILEKAANVKWGASCLVK